MRRGWMAHLIVRLFVGGNRGADGYESTWERRAAEMREALEDEELAQAAARAQRRRQALEALSAMPPCQDVVPLLGDHVERSHSDPPHFGS